MNEIQENNIDLFKEYKLIHNFIYPKNPLKKWINKTNFNNLFKKDWNELMFVIEKCTSIWGEYEFDTEERLLMEYEIWNINGTLLDFLNGDIEAIYRRTIRFIKWYNKQNK